MASRNIDDEPAAADIELLQVLQALSDPVRLSIVTQLARTDAAISCGAFELDVSPSTSSHHFSTLRQAGIIHQYYVGTSRMNRLRVDDLGAAVPGLLDAVTVPAARKRARTT